MKETYLNTKNRVVQLKQQIKDADAELKQMIINVITDTAKKQVAKKISKHIMIVNFSDINGKVWNPLFYNWESSAELLLKKIENKSGIESYDYLMKLPKSENKMGTFEIKNYVQDWFAKYEIKQYVDKEFVMKIIETLEK